MKCVIDTHALIWHFDGDERLGREAGKILYNPRTEIICPTIVLAEIVYLSKKRRTQKGLDIILTTMSSDPRFKIYPFDEEVLLRMPSTLEMHDAIIVATAFVFIETLNEEVPILTKDKDIRKIQGIVTIW